MNRIMTSLTGTPRVIAGGVALTVLAIACTFLLDPYRNYQLALVAAYLCATAGLTLLIGLTGQLSLGHAALMAAGGYGYALTANALTDAGVDGLPRFVLGLLAGVVAAGVIGLLLGLAAARLHGPYLAGVTLALVIALPAFTSVFVGVFRGDQGVQIAYDGVPEALSTLIAVEQWQAWVAILVAGITLTLLTLVRNGKAGLRMRAVRDDEVAARLSGIPAGRVKVHAFLVSALGAGAGGAVLCFVTQSVSPGAYTLAFSLLLVVAVVVGGLGSILGAAIGSALIVLLPWLVQMGTGALSLPGELQQRLSGNLPVLVFGALLIVVTAVWPGGIRGALRGRKAVRGRRPARPSAAQKRAIPTRAEIPVSRAANRGSSPATGSTASGQAASGTAASGPAEPGPRATGPTASGTAASGPTATGTAASGTTGHSPSEPLTSEPRTTQSLTTEPLTTEPVSTESER